LKDHRLIHLMEHMDGHHLTQSCEVPIGCNKTWTNQ
jgi:hypothetical protein